MLNPAGETGGAERRALRLVYYCSGHGYGHATRVSALARHLLSLDKKIRPIVHIVSSAPQHVFADSIACGAHYRYAVIDPVIVQPLAYRVDRQKSVKVLKDFLAKKGELLERERRWLLDIGANGVLSDAAFLGCSVTFSYVWGSRCSYLDSLAGKAAGVPSILVTNFSFDSVYSYLSTTILDSHSSTPAHQLHPEHGRETGVIDALIPDDPIPWMELEPLVEQIHAGYRCADLLLLLPGYIPMPSFFKQPPLPASSWIDTETLRMHTHVIQAMTSDQPLLPSIPFGSSELVIPRKVIHAPLLVRTPNPKADVCTPEGRSRFLHLLGVPEHRHGPDTKVLIVSFGGQNFHQPSRNGSRTHSRNTSRESLADLAKLKPLQDLPVNAKRSPRPPDILVDKDAKISARLATESHIWVPGAPPAFKSGVLTPNPRTPTIIPPTPSIGIEQAYFDTPSVDDLIDEPSLLPDHSWIAVVCGVSKDQWANPGEDMPEGFHIAPKDVYMPDLTLLADVLLGKLGYGTVSECVDSCTPFVYVSRPLFVEEHGLRLLLEKEGVGVELPRECYEAGDWATAITDAHIKGKQQKERRRSEAAREFSPDKRDREGQELATIVVDWVKEWGAKIKA